MEFMFSLVFHIHLRKKKTYWGKYQNIWFESKHEKMWETEAEIQDVLDKNPDKLHWLLLKSQNSCVGSYFQENKHALNEPA